MQYLQHSSENGLKIFKLAPYGKDCPDIGLYTVTDGTSCKKAAVELGGTFVGFEEEKWSPRGCYSDQWKNVRLNDHATGAKSSKRKVICKGK